MIAGTDHGKKWVPLMLCIAVCSISFAAIFFRKAAPTHPLVSAGLRLLIAALLLFPLALSSHRRKKASRRLLRYGALAGIAYGIHFGSWVTSLMMTSVAASVTLVTTTPLILAIAGLITGRDRPEKRLWLGLLLAFVGLLILGGGDLGLGGQALFGDGLAFVGALAMACYMTLGRRLGDEMELWIFSALACAVGSILLLGGALCLGISIAPVGIEAFLFIFAAAALPQLIGHNLLTWSLRYTSSSNVAMAVVGEPVGATILAWVWLGESMTFATALGCALTLAAVLWVIRSAGIAVAPKTPTAFDKNRE